MKLKCKFLILIGVMALSGDCKAQLNLVPNPSFEDTINCFFSGLGGGGNKCDKWYSCKYSPDYWTDCSQFYTVPYTLLSYQFPHNGEKMFGIVTNATQNVLQGIVREIPGVDLIQSAILGNKYFFQCLLIKPTIIVHL